MFFFPNQYIGRRPSTGKTQDISRFLVLVSKSIYSTSFLPKQKVEDMLPAERENFRIQVERRERDFLLWYFFLTGFLTVYGRRAGRDVTNLFHIIFLSCCGSGSSSNIYFYFLRIPRESTAAPL